LQEIEQFKAKNIRLGQTTSCWIGRKLRQNQGNQENTNWRRKAKSKYSRWL